MFIFHIIFLECFIAMFSTLPLQGDLCGGINGRVGQPGEPAERGGGGGDDPRGGRGPGRRYQ